jgi:sortase (surface protein transpeptidase)
MMCKVVFLETYTDLYRYKIDVIEKNPPIDVDIRIVLHDKPHDI